MLKLFKRLFKPEPDWLRERRLLAKVSALVTMEQRRRRA